MDERNDITHLTAHAREYVLDVFKDLANLSTHVLGADDLALSVESNLALQVNDLAVALDDGHRERAEWGPNTSRIDSIHQ